MQRLLLIVGVVAAGVASIAAPDGARAAASRTWPPFVLVVGLLLVGEVAHGDGLFDRAAALAGRVRGHGALLFAALLALVAVATVLLNLDTAVAFLTPVLVLASRRRGLSEEPFLYGSLFMANSASLLLPGSNLTNLLVLEREHVAGAVFAARMAPAWTAAVAMTAAVLVVWFRRSFSDGEPSLPGAVPGAGALGLLATATAGALVVALRSPALPVLGVGAAAVAVDLARGRMSAPDITEIIDIEVLVGLFALAVALGTLAGSWSGPGSLLQSATAWETAAIAAVGAVLVNNLPAAVLFSARSPAHPRALLVGLDLGPNLAVTGSLSALLWYRSAQRVAARPSVRRVSAIGVVLMPCSAAAALLALRIVSGN
ncbi:MAG: hypothetical protein HYX34_15615 [Actinobacteria bacterium]|nr:hypothetical protein [Actinomycetota bacterium]